MQLHINYVFDLSTCTIAPDQIHYLKIGMTCEDFTKHALMDRLSEASKDERQFTHG